MRFKINICVSIRAKKTAAADNAGDRLILSEAPLQAMLLRPSRCFLLQICIQSRLDR